MVPDEMDPDPTIVDIVAEDDDFSTLAGALGQADLTETLAGMGPFTVFAPTNTAFNQFLDGNDLTAEQLLGSENLAEILQYHVVSGSVPSTAVEAGEVSTLGNGPFYISIAPDNSIWINGNAQIIDTDIEASNGIIHVLDNVITAPAGSIAEIVSQSANAEMAEFTQLLAALDRASLVEPFTGGTEDNLTVFAPTDEAFQALYETLGVDGVDDIPVETLAEVLSYHVVPARAFSQDLRDGDALPTLLEGETLNVDLENLTINGSGLIASSLNIHAENGVIHAIDQVILPAADEEAVGATITLDNVGASAYIISSIEGDAATGTLDENNTAINLQRGQRYTFINNGGASHPLDFRDADGNILLAEGSEAGSFEEDEAVDFEVDGANISFTLTEELAEVIAAYRCTVHGAMEGVITVTD